MVRMEHAVFFEIDLEAEVFRGKRITRRLVKPFNLLGLTHRCHRIAHWFTEFAGKWLQPRRMARSMSRFTSAFFRSSRLSYSFLPLQRPTRTFATPPIVEV